MANTYRNGSSSPLKKVSIMALVQELKRRKEVKFIKDKDLYIITVPKKEVDI